MACTSFSVIPGLPCVTVYAHSDGAITVHSVSQITSSMMTLTHDDARNMIAALQGALDVLNASVLEAA